LCGRSDRRPTLDVAATVRVSAISAMPQAGAPLAFSTTEPSIATGGSSLGVEPHEVTE
jgi:hypothetical protein